MTREELEQDYNNGLISEAKYNDWLNELESRDSKPEWGIFMWPFILMIYGGIIIWAALSHWVIQPIFYLVRSAWGRDKQSKLHAYIIICFICFGTVILWRLV